MSTVKAKAKKRLSELTSKLYAKKPSDPSPTTPSPPPMVTSLTPSEHLLRQMALRYLVDQTLTIKEVANKLKISVRKLNTFFEEEDFMEELNARIDRIHGMDNEYRTKQAKITINHLYEEIRRREAEDELRGVPLRDLHKMLTDMQKEVRLDTPGEYTSKVGVADLSNLQDRFKKSLSGKLARKQAKIRSLPSGKKFLGEGNGSSEDEDSKETKRGGSS